MDIQNINDDDDIIFCESLPQGKSNDIEKEQTNLNFIKSSNTTS